MAIKKRTKHIHTGHVSRIAFALKNPSIGTANRPVLSRKPRFERNFDATNQFQTRWRWNHRSKGLKYGMQKTNPLHHRRLVLQSVTGSLLIPSLASLSRASDHSVSPTTGKEANAGQPRRFVAVGNLLGFQQKHFFPEAAGKNYKTTTLLTPLESQREKFTVYRGLDHGLRGGHFAVHTFLSGVLHHESKNRHSGNITLDQYLADSIGGETRFPSLTVGSEGGIHGGCQLSWTRSGVRVPPITGPAELFEKLFVGNTKVQRERKVRENQLQASILDSVTLEATELSKRINSEDRNKLDEYLSSIRDVEKTLQTRKTWTNQPKPTAPFEKPANTNTVDDLPILYELIALALQTDSTRVATLEIGGSFLPQTWESISRTTACLTMEMMRKSSPTCSPWKLISWISFQSSFHAYRI